MEGMTTGQVARRLGLSEARIGQLARAGRLPFRQTPLGRLFDRDAIEEIARAREEKRLAAQTA